MKPSQPSSVASSSSAKLSPERLDAGMRALKLLLKGRPDTSSENPKYTAEMVECLAHLTDSELAAVTDPRKGVHTKTPYLPTPFDVHALLRDARARQEASQPAPTTWRKLEPETGPWDAETNADRKRRVVRELLGYDPDDRKPKHRLSTPPISVQPVSLAPQTPSSPPSKYLKKVLGQQGFLKPDKERD